MLNATINELFLGGMLLSFIALIIFLIRNIDLE